MAQDHQSRRLFIPAQAVGMNSKPQQAPALTRSHGLIGVGKRSPPLGFQRPQERQVRTAAPALGSGIIVRTADGTTHRRYTSSR
jgi:hypothetical protein